LQTYHVVLFIHLVSLLIAAGAVTTLHIADVEIRRARTLSEAGRLAMRMKKTAHAFPFAVVGLVGSGIYMTHHLAWGFSTPWVLGGEVGLGAIIVVGDVVNGGYGKKLGAAIGGAIARGGDGPLTDEVLARLDDPIAKFAGVAPTGLMFGVIYLMTVKPGALGSALAPLIALALGGIASQVLLRTPAAVPAAAPAAEPA
jgi:hypothetical protein